MYKELNGTMFNTLFSGKSFLKVLNNLLIHGNVKYKVGLNVDPVKFNPTGTCLGGGLYFTTEELISEYFSHGEYIAVVLIPANARVYVDEFKFKADRIEISQIMTMSDYFDKLSHETILKYITENPYLIEHVKNQTSELCTIAVGKCVETLQYVKNQTPELCLMAVRKNGFVLRHIKRQTHEICMEAVKESAMALQHVERQTHEICMEAVRRDGKALCYVHDQTPEICEVAVKQDAFALMHVENKTLKLCTIAVNKDKYMMKCVCLQYVNMEKIWNMFRKISRLKKFAKLHLAKILDLSCSFLTDSKPKKCVRRR